MDPDATLEELRSLVLAQLYDTDVISPAERSIREQRARSRPVGAVPDPERMAELVDALDKWLSKGGFPPKAWAQRIGTVQT